MKRKLINKIAAELLTLDTDTLKSILFVVYELKGEKHGRDNKSAD